MALQAAPRWEKGGACEIRGLFLLFTWFGGISCMICKLMGARWLFQKWCVKLQAILTLIEEFLDLGCLYVFKVYFVFCFAVALGLKLLF